MDSGHEQVTTSRLPGYLTAESGFGGVRRSQWPWGNILMASVADQPSSSPDSFAVSPSPDSRVYSMVAGGEDRTRARWVIAPTPVAVWTPGSLLPCFRRRHRPGFGEPPCAWRWPTRLWESVLAAYSRPGDRVLVTDGADGTPVRVAVGMQRRIVARIPSRLQRAGLYLELLEDQPRRVRRQIVLFGDQPASHAALASSDAASATTSGTAGPGLQWPAKALRNPVDLLVIPPPCPADQPAPGSTTADHNGSHIHAATGSVPLGPGAASARDSAGAGAGVGDASLAWQLEVLAARTALVRPGGVVVVVTRLTPAREGAVDRIGPVVARARSLGLRYLQHVPVVHVDLRDGRFQPAYGPDDPSWHLDLTDEHDLAEWWRLPLRHPASSDGVGPTGQPRLHMPIHSDALVFFRDSHLGTDLKNRTAVHVAGGAQ